MIISHLLPSIVGAVFTVLMFFVGRLTGRQQPAAVDTAAAELHAWMDCRVTLVVDGHPYLDATLLQLQTAHSSDGYGQLAELPPMAVISVPGVELTFLQIPPLSPREARFIPSAEHRGGRTPLAG